MSDPRSQIPAHYDGVYRADSSAFSHGGGDNPASITRALHSALPNGEILELGTGQGRNALWLARQGHYVEAFDISRVGLKQLKIVTQHESLPITVKETDARTRLVRKYNGVLATYLLHCLSREEVYFVVREMKRSTLPGGVNALSAFMEDGDFFQSDPLTNYFYARPHELKRLYSGWQIIKYLEKRSESRVLREDGSPMFNMVAEILAVKPPRSFR